MTEQVAPDTVPRPRGVARLMAGLIRFYQLGISPLLRPSCRFAPTCSEYAYEALSVHGATRGSWLAVRRLLRCHPFCDGGYDPVPPSKRRRESRVEHSGHSVVVGPEHPESSSPPVSASLSAASATSQEAGECLC